MPKQTGFSFFNWLGLSDTKVGGWLMAAGVAILALCDHSCAGGQCAGMLATVCTLSKAIGAAGFGVLVNGGRNAMGPATPPKA